MKMMLKFATAQHLFFNHRFSDFDSFLGPSARVQANASALLNDLKAPPMARATLTEQKEQVSDTRTMILFSSLFF